MAAFFDTNIFLYAGSAIPQDRSKRDIARKLIVTTEFVISSQVLQEYISNALGKKALGLGEEQITALVNGLSDEQILPVTRQLILHGLEIRRRFKVSHWDSTIIAAALELGCEVLYTEDLSHGQNYGSLRVVNPFL